MYPSYFIVMEYTCLHHNSSFTGVAFFVLSPSLQFPMSLSTQNQ